MININVIRNHPKIIKKDLEKRKDKEKLKWIDEIAKLDAEWRQLQYDKQKVVQGKNVLSMQVAKLKKEGKNAEADKLLEEVKSIPAKIGAFEAKQLALRQKIDDYLMRLPNILHETVPVGDGDEGNVTIKTVGKKPTFKFELKSHVDLLEKLDIGDIERAAKIAGSRFYFLKGKLAELDLALQKYAVDFMTKKGYQLIYPPFMMNRAAYEGVTDLADFESVMYKIEGEDLYLIATSEHPLTAMYKDEVLFPEQLPMKMCGLSTCFRKEAGSHGKDTKGIFRVHQFNKIEQIVICRPEDSWKFHEELLRNAMELFESLGLHFKVISICTGDIGTVAAKKYDIEVWMPAQNTYREVVSCSNCTDYQARRLNIRYREGNDKKTVHTLNSTAIATGRALVAIMENFQDKEGNIHIPKVLHPYMNGLKIITKTMAL